MSSAMSSMRIVSLVASTTVTAITALVLVLSDLPGHYLHPPDDLTQVLFVATVLVWIANLASCCRDATIRVVRARADAHDERLALVAARVEELAASIVDYGDRQAAEGQVAALRSMAAPTAAGQDALGRLRAVGRPGAG